MRTSYCLHTNPHTEKTHSCETSLIKLVDDLLWAIEKQLVTAVMILDLSAAFNAVDHDLLLEVLEKRFGVTNKAKNGTVIT